ncbi:MAG: potassium-transporting ATPase subunit KdpA [Bacteroidetes bacterium]|nr:potassium-transporting ATPase subunit KdpA [Bacteroidota bacterium]
MNTELFGVIFMFLGTLLLAIPLGKYIAKVYAGDRVWTDVIFAPIERMFFRVSRIDISKEMNWKQHLVALLTINLVWFLWAMFCLMNQGWLPMNPDHITSQSPDLAFNTAISFLVNCNLQHYSGESGASYFTQVYGLMFLQFVSAGTGMAAAAVVFNALKERATDKLGNFYNYFLKSCTRILLPLCILIGTVQIFEGTPMTFKGMDTIVTMQGDTQHVSRGPVAAFVAIKHLGTNGGGFYGANSAHPLENPNYLSNMVQMIAQVLIPFAMIFAMGFFLRRKKLAWVIWSVMTIGFLALVIPTINAEIHGNVMIAKMGISQPLGNMEGKEIRFGARASAYWSIATTVISTGSVNSMHDSFMPLSGMNMLLGMMVNSFYGGVGVGFLNFYVYLILAVFIGGLMVGRTPEFLGKKVEAKEMKIAMIVALLHPFLILVGTAIASHLAAHDAAMGWWWMGADGKPMHATAWLNNPRYHGFSEMLYEYTSSSANNGSGFEGLGDNNPFWNISTGIVLILSRFIPIIGPVAIAGLLAQKKHIPESAGTLKPDTATFGTLILAVKIIIAALAFFPALALGPIAEWLSM